MLTERDEQLAALDARWSRARTGAGQLVLVEGAAATGKTELLHTFGQVVEDHEPLRLQATCSPAERALPLGVVGQLFLGLDLPAAARTRTEALIERITPGGDNVTSMHSLCRELVELAVRAPMLITVDDVQHADPTSTLWLLCLARRIASARVLVVLAGDPGPYPDFAPTRTELLRLPHSGVIHTALLSRQGVDTFLAGTFGPLTTQLLTDPFHAASGGNPYLLTALVDDLRAGRGIAGRGYQQAMLDCVRRCGPLALRVAQGLAVLGRPSPLVSTLLDIGPDAVADTVHTLDTAGLLVKGGVAHRSGRSALLAVLPARERVRLHSAAARLLHEQGAPATTVAQHIVAGASDESFPWREILADAAETHLLDNQVPAAMQCLEHTIRHSADDRGAARGRARLALVEWCADPVVAARHLTPLVAAAEAGLLSVGECVEVCRQLLWHGRDDEAATVLDRLCALDDHEARAFELWLACTHPRLVRRGQRPVVRRQPRSVARVPAWQRFSVALADILHGHHGQGLTLWEQLLGESHVHKDSRWSPDSPLESLMPGVYAGALDAATTWCRLWSADRTAGPPVRQAQLAAVAAEIAVRRDDFAAAVDHARTAVETLSMQGWGAAVGLPLGALVLAATRMGDLDTAAEQLRQPVPRAMFDSRHGVHYLYARGTYQLARDNVHAALSDFLTCGDLMRQWSLDTAGLVPWRVGAAQALLRQGDHDQARKLLTEQLARVDTDTDTGPVRGAALRLLAACSPQNQRVELLTVAVDTIESGGNRYELALALADLSHAQETSGEHRTARLTARRAWHVAKSCHAEPICQALAPKRAHTDPPLPAPASGPAVLSPAERRVATLASDGYSNRVIASKLLVTESTVEQHLTKVYRKLNVKHRGNLPASFPR